MSDDLKDTLHADDRNPWDTSPMTEAEAVHDMKVTSTLLAMAQALERTRRSLALEELARMTFVYPQFEAELPEIDGVRHGVFLYTVGGTLDRAQVHRALLAGHCMQISAAGRAEADRLASSGLADTITHALAHAFEQAQGNAARVNSEENAGLFIDAGGKRVQ